MYRLDRFNRKKECLKYTMPFGRIIHPQISADALQNDYDGDLKNVPAIVLNKDGSLQVTWSYRGPDLDSEIRERLAIITMQLNNAFSSLQTGWILYFEAQRSASMSYAKDTYFPDLVTKAMDDERKRLFLDSKHFESNYYATAYWMPPNDQEGRMKEIVIEGRKRKEASAEDNIRIFWEKVNKIFNIFQSLNIPSQFLNQDEMLTYLHSIVSDNARPLTMPEHPLLLDHYLYDTPVYGGLEPRMGNQHIRVVAPLAYPSDTIFGLFDRLNRLNFSYRWVTRFYCLSKQDSISSLETIKNGWNGKIKSITSMAKELIFNREDDGNINENALRKFDEVKDAISAVEADTTNYGYYSTAVVVMDKDVELVEKKAKYVWQEFINLGMKAKVEDLNALDAWMGCIPGAVGHYIRRPMVSAGNLVHMMPVSDVWAGPERNKHLNAPVLLYTQTDGNTPFRLSLHVGSVGHSLLVGPTGAGKSVHLNMIAASFRKYKDARVIIFDNGASSRVLTEGVGGNFYNLGGEKGALSFQPLAKIDDELELQWAQEWLCDYARRESVEITPEFKKIISDALKTLATAPERLRTISGFIDNLQEDRLKTVFLSISIRGNYGHIFDSNEDTLEFSSWQSFEMNKLIKTPIIGSVLMYIFHRIEQQLTGQPTIIIIDECWIFFDNPMFADKIREWLKTLRKFNASVVFATQSLTDITNTPIFSTVLESCQSRIFLPNANALEEKAKKTYISFGLNQRQIEIIASAVPKRQYYYNSPLGSRIYELALESCPITLAYAAATDTADSKYCQRIIDEFGKEDFNPHWMRYKNVVLTKIQGERESYI
ncbi:MAG: trbE [Firmicutes bacterium]|nr:trbE [Bacillota bacterium]